MDIAIDELRRRLAYDSETGDLTWLINVGTAAAGSSAGTIATSGYRRLKFDRAILFAHRVAWALHFGAWPRVGIDHIDGNKSNNRISNLRLATAAENAQNRKVNRNNTSGFAGVSWNGSGWTARIRTPGKRHCIGFFKTPEEAGRAYLQAKARLHPFNPTQRTTA